MKSALAFLLVMSAVAVNSVAGNIELDVTGDDRRVIDLGVFGYNAGGYFSLKVTHFFADDPAGLVVGKDGKFSHNESIGFVLDMVDSAQAARYQRTYARTDDKERRVCYIDDPDLMPSIGKSGRHVYLLQGKDLTAMKEEDFFTTITVPGLYALFFFNCKGYKDKGMLQNIGISFTAETVQYNVGANGEKNYLSVGEQPLPYIFGFFTLVFFGLTYVWHREMKLNPQYVHRIHQVMYFLVIVKALSLLFETLKFSHYASTGHGSVWDLFYYAFLTVKGVTLFAVVVLLGTGWSFLKSMMSEKDKKLLMFVLPAQVIVNICLAIVEETSEGSAGWGSWSDLLRILDVVCCCVVLLPIVWSIKDLREAAEHDEKAAQTLARMRLFRTFYIVVVAYIYFTRIIIVMIEGSLPYYYLWTSRALLEVVAVAFYVYTGIKFRPMLENPYTHLSKQDIEELEARQEVPQDHP